MYIHFALEIILFNIYYKRFLSSNFLYPRRGTGFWEIGIISDIEPIHK